MGAVSIAKILFYSILLILIFVGNFCLESSRCLIRRAGFRLVLPLGHQDFAAPFVSNSKNDDFLSFLLKRSIKILPPLLRFPLVLPFLYPSVSPSSIFSWQLSIFPVPNFPIAEFCRPLKFAAMGLGPKTAYVNPALVIRIE